MYAAISSASRFLRLKFIFACGPLRARIREAVSNSNFRPMTHERRRIGDLIASTLHGDGMTGRAAQLRQSLTRFCIGAVRAGGNNEVQAGTADYEHLHSGTLH